MKTLNNYSPDEVIDRWLSAVETGNPNGDYAKVTVYEDGPNGQRQITFGKHQTTEAGDNLKRLVQAMLAEYGRHIPITQQMSLRIFLDNPPYSPRSNNLIMGLRTIGPIAARVQDEFFDDQYTKPAMAWAHDNGFTLPLSYLVIRDSFIQSGGIMPTLRRKFPECVPAKGGNERVWVTQYVDTRLAWKSIWGDGLSGKSIAIRRSIYRDNGLRELIRQGDWGLIGAIGVNGIKVV